MVDHYDGNTPPNDRRGFVHKRIIGAVVGGLTGGLPGAIGGFAGGGGGPSVIPGVGGGGSGLCIGQHCLGSAPNPKLAEISSHIAHGHIPGEVLWTASPHPTTAGVSSAEIQALVAQHRGQDATPIGTTPGERSLGGAGIFSPSRVCVDTFVCPTYADGKKGILWMMPLSGEIVCLPRGVNGKGFGLIRKNKPRAKAFISAAENKLLTKRDTLEKKAKDFATKAGFSCKKR